MRSNRAWRMEHCICSGHIAAVELHAGELEDWEKSVLLQSSGLFLCHALCFW
jgi:hypothetical protein